MVGAVRVGRLVSSDAIPVGGLTPGSILVDRYRIIGLLGRGGMGEVYRADDLKLGQPVALKFLPRELSADPVRRERFFAEVRITRQLSHPNICRVYDIAEANNQHFLSMEFIDAEAHRLSAQREGARHRAAAGRSGTPATATRRSPWSRSSRCMGFASLSAGSKSWPARTCRTDASLSHYFGRPRRPTPAERRRRRAGERDSRCGPADQHNLADMIASPRLY
jgi:hypothetical protein